MAKYKILALPVDGRPVTREQVQMVARIAGCEVLCPPVASLGHFRESADRDLLKNWIAQHVDAVDGFIFSLDMLVYGGLVPSRFIEDGQDALRARLGLLGELKAGYPDKPLYGFSATMRMSNNNENEEEKRYWSQYGKDIWAWSYHSDRHACAGDAQDQELAETARNRIPAEIQQDYLNTRARNFAITREVLALVERGTIDRLILPQDDTAEYGFNIAERRKLQQWVVERELNESVLIYPGADEVIYTLLVHQLQTLEHRNGVSAPALRIALRPHHAAALNAMVARYEDRPVMESIRCQIHAAGAELVADEASADVVIAVHCRGAKQGDWAMQYPLAEDLGLDAQWVAQLKQDLKDKRRPVALLDLAYANGGDPELLSALENSAEAGLAALQAYSGWNTASNSIGSLVAQLCAATNELRAGRQGAHNQHLLATRLLDDYLYQSRLRQTLRAEQRDQGLADGDTQTLEQVYVATARQWLARQRFNTVSLEGVYFPWHRSFEIGLRTSLATTETVEAAV
ncbi:DUF4127 family protein [Microbulbifer sp. Q7]|uniref:DUF4127 family protein n=1 Tax=Microbulbifer sp. Q7 TaxID=1785091 RepID=UPI0008301507|nr:DUF4127 family protein [Microbulbifer sp. Q7]